MSHSPIPLALGLGILLGATTAWFAPLPAPAAAAVSSSGLPPPRSSPPAPASLFAAWLDLRGPDGAPASFALRAETLRALLARLPAADFPRMLDPLSLRTDPDDRRLLAAAFEIWTERDPASAARWAGALKPAPGLDPAGLARQAAREWAELDAPAAAAWALTLADTRGDAFFKTVFPVVFERLGQTDPAAALATYGPRLWKDGQGFFTLIDAIGQWTDRDPDSALVWLLAQPRRHDRELLNWINALGNGRGDRASIANAVLRLPHLPNRHMALSNMLSSWSTTRPEAALAWINALPDRALRVSLLQQVSQHEFAHAPQLSLPLLLALPEGADRQNHLSRTLRRWAANEPAAALAWIRAHDEPDLAQAKVFVQAAALADIARFEPRTALAEWQALPDGPLKSKAIADIALAWGQTDPAAALQWASEQGPKLGASHYQSTDLIFAWARKDGPAALRWAEALPDEKARRHALDSLAGNWSEKSPRATTADLYAQIKDTTLRAQYVANHLQEWLAKDPAAAKTWLESSPALTPAQRAALLTAKP